MIHARGLARTFRKKKQEVHAVVGVDLDVEAGEIVGFLGPNGAGKTTTLRMLTTLLEPTAGTATVAGCDLITDPVGVRRRIGYVSQSGSTAPEARAGEEVVDHARLYGMSTAEATERGKQLFRELDLDGLWERQPKTMSGGQRRRLDIAVGLIHIPELVFLDEPTTGLDPQARANLWQHISSLREQRGTTVFLTTHYLDEADALCDRILVIDHGAIVAEGTPDQLKSQVGGDVLTVTAADSAQMAGIARLMGMLPGAEAPQLVEDRVIGRVPHGGAALVELVRGLDREGLAVSGIESRRPSLDDVFLGLTGRSLRDAGAAEPAAEVAV
ncbi:ATP-binding cassette domain-containing protein [Blastococcus haudaquaticus]|uniref:ABC-2 type transport system ATP-binding protein n=1 Tax=Blastococcus haudaquaticus TaxID=1938745 RepID=A0A286H014_9ACTN|nr:ATP-binding cassette domain-containing protein [Blastococcus haudaquaticus]SOE01130.1 ABC-2 type transport system ATP-binding protein [Blastococcus haudaquaticus]